MARIPRVHIEGALFYVTSRGDNNADIFKDNDDYKMYLELLKKYKAQHGFKLFAFVLMPNHLHLLIELKEGITISDIMHDLNSNYTKYFNGKYQRKGHLFQERSRLVILEKSAYLSKVAAYIHLNPLLLNLVENLKYYAHSSYGLYSERRACSSEVRDLWPVMEEEIKEAGIPDYVVFLAGISKEEMKALGVELSKNVILGSNGFVEKVKQREAEREAAEPRGLKTEQRKFIYVSVAGIAVLTLLTLYLYGRTAALRKNLKNEITKKNVELSTRLEQERKKVVKDIEEKYAADKVSYDAMAKRLELEKKKAKDLEEKAKNENIEQPKNAKK